MYEMLGGGLPEPGVNMGPIPSGRKSDLQQLMESTRGQFAFLQGCGSGSELDQDPNWIRVQSGQWIRNRICNRDQDRDPRGQK